MRWKVATFKHILPLWRRRRFSTSRWTSTGSQLRSRIQSCSSKRLGVTYIGYITQGSSDRDIVIMQVSSRNKFRSMWFLNITISIGPRFHLFNTYKLGLGNGWFAQDSIFICLSSRQFKARWYSRIYIRRFRNDVALGVPSVGENV